MPPRPRPGRKLVRVAEPQEVQALVRMYGRGIESSQSAARFQAGFSFCVPGRVLYYECTTVDDDALSGGGGGGGDSAKQGGREQGQAKWGAGAQAEEEGEAADARHVVIDVRVRAGPGAEGGAPAAGGGGAGEQAAAAVTVVAPERQLERFWSSKRVAGRHKGFQPRWTTAQVRHVVSRRTYG